MSAPTRETVTVRLPLRDGPRDVQGEIIVPGLAITPSPKSTEEAPRFCLTHVASGLSYVDSKCRTHIEAAADLVIKAGIDWQCDKETLLADKQPLMDLRLAIDAVGAPRGWCSRACERGDGTGWDVRCNTCDWVWEDEDDEGPLTEKEAKELARGHECEPDVEIQAPNSKDWLPVGTPFGRFR